MAKAALTLSTSDSVGYVPDQTQIGTVWVHFKTPESRYYIIGFAWDAEADRWKYKYKEQNSLVECVRTPEYFHGLVGAKSDKVPEGFIDQYVERFKRL